MAEQPTQQQTAAKSAKVPFAFALLAVVGLIAGLFIGAWADNLRLAVVVAVTIAAAPFTWWSASRRARGGSSLEEAEQLSAQETSALHLAIVGVLVGVAIVAAGTYWRVFWLVTVLGVALVGLGWKHRSEHSLRGALAFVGVLVTIYGILGWYVAIKSR